MIIHDTEHFAVVLLTDNQKTDPEYNYGIMNKEFNVFDVQTASEAAAIMLCEQHNMTKQDRVGMDEEEKPAAIQLAFSKPKDTLQ